MIIKKNNFRKILVAFCIGTFLCTGCHNKQNITQLESYDGKEQVSEAKEESRREYKYLAKTTVKNGDAEVRLFTPSESERVAASQSKATLHGVTINNELLKTAESPKQISKKGLKEEKDILASKKKIQNIVSDKGSGNEKTFLFSLSYDITKKDTIYPCMEIIRAEKVTPEYVLKTIITVDNRYTDKESNSLLQEISAAYGINLQN